MLPDLAQVNALVQRDDGGWYRYHSLFAAVLRLKLRRDDPGGMQDLHLRAAPVVPPERVPRRGGPARRRRR